LDAEGEELFRRAAAAGLDIQWMANVEQKRDPLFDPAVRKRHLEWAAEHGVSFCSGAAGFLKVTGLHSLDESERIAALSSMKRWTAIYAEIGVGLILLPIFKPEAFDNPDCFERLIEGLKRSCALAQEQGQRLCIETCAQTDVLLGVIERFDSEVLSVYVDTANVLFYGMDPSEHIRALGRHVGEVHFKGLTVESGLAGSDLDIGLVDFRACADALAEIGFDGSIVLETPPGPDPVASARKNLAFARERMS